MPGAAGIRGEVPAAVHGTRLAGATPEDAALAGENLPYVCCPSLQLVSQCGSFPDLSTANGVSYGGVAPFNASNVVSVQHSTANLLRCCLT
jgi:hypothetical protein